MPFCELMTLIAIEQIKTEGMRYVPTLEDEQKEFLNLLTVR